VCACSGWLRIVCDPSIEDVRKAEQRTPCGFRSLARLILGKWHIESLQVCVRVKCEEKTADRAEAGSASRLLQPWAGLGVGRRRARSGMGRAGHGSSLARFTHRLPGAYNGIMVWLDSHLTLRDHQRMMMKKGRKALARLKRLAG